MHALLDNVDSETEIFIDAKCLRESRVRVGEPAKTPLYSPKPKQRRRRRFGARQGAPGMDFGAFEGINSEQCFDGGDLGIEIAW